MIVSRTKIVIFFLMASLTKIVGMSKIFGYWLPLDFLVNGQKTTAEGGGGAYSAPPPPCIRGIKPYCSKSKKSCPFSYCAQLYKNGQDFLDIQFIKHIQKIGILSLVAIIYIYDIYNIYIYIYIYI